MEPFIQDESNNFSRNLKLFRNKNGFTQQALADKLLVSRGYLSQLESLKLSKLPSMSMTFTIAKNLNIETYKLFIDFETNKKKESN